MNVKDRRVDLYWKLQEKSLVEIDEICKLITQERLDVMKEKSRALTKSLLEFLPDGWIELGRQFPESVESYIRALSTFEAQALRWVWDEASPVEWDDSDAYRAAAELGRLAMYLSLCRTIVDGKKP
jgi:hypothetical protein